MLETRRSHAGGRLGSMRQWPWKHWRRRPCLWLQALCVKSRELLLLQRQWWRVRRRQAMQLRSSWRRTKAARPQAAAVQLRGHGRLQQRRGLRCVQLISCCAIGRFTCHTPFKSTSAEHSASSGSISISNCTYRRHLAGGIWLEASG